MNPAQYTFESYRDWSAKYDQVRISHRSYKENEYEAVFYNSVLQQCSTPEQFFISREMGLFPIRWFWPSDIPGWVAELDVRFQIEFVEAITKTFHSAWEESAEDVDRSFTALPNGLGMVGPIDPDGVLQEHFRWLVNDAKRRNNLIPPIIIDTGNIV